MRRVFHQSAYFFAACFGLWLPKSYGAVLVDLDARSLPTGSLPTWDNTGTVAGDFVAPTAAVPSVTTLAGVNGVTFNGTSHYYTGPGAPLIVTGAAPRTIEAWLYNPAAADEETIFAWARRGEPPGSNLSFNHGLNPTFGAVGHWGAPDIGWNGQIAVGRWTYVAYTYDGNTARVFMDGEQANSEDVLLDTWAFDNTPESNLLPFRIASQNEPNGTPTAAFRGSMTIAKIRVHDETLDPTVIKGNYDSLAISFGLGDQDTDQLPTWYENQYSAFLNPTDPSDAAKDQDTDGLTNLQEFQKGTRPDLADTDGDGINDGVEANRTAGGNPAPTDPLKADTDGDGLNDKVETGTGTFVSATDTGTDPLLNDTDADTFGDYQEMVSGSNPNSASSVPGETRPPLVLLDATTQAAGPLQAWPNAGAIGGDFTSPTTAVPQVSRVQGVNAVTFNGTSHYYTGPGAPAFVTGNASRTVEAWILNPVAADEETIFSWGRRGGPAGSNNSFNHGVHPDWGAVGIWGAPDIGWGGTENVKQGQWTYVVFTYDGTAQTTTVYSDGVMANTEQLTAPLNTHAVDTLGRPLPFRVAAQSEANGNVTGGLRGSMSIAEVKVYDRVLDAATIANNFTAGQDKYGLVDYDSDGLPTWYERQYNFDERNAADASQDADSDSLTNLQEFTLGTLPRTADSDSDTINDGAEVNRAAGATNPLQGDSDQDGLSDAAENATGTFVDRNNAGTDPLTVDSDGDGFPDGQEAFAGSNPTQVGSVPTFRADRPIVDLNAENLVTGALTTWPNSGSMGGNFISAGEGATVEAAGGIKGVVFDGNDEYVGPVAPAWVAGNASRTVDAWVFNPAVAGEETVVAWGRRGGPDGSNASYIHGTNGTFGAMGQWGAGPDVGWGTATPVAGAWTHLAYVYDGPTLTATVYMDGVQVNQEVMPFELLVHAVDSANRPLPFRLGAQNAADGNSGGIFATMTMGRVRVYDQALAAADITALYNAEKGDYVPQQNLQISTVSRTGNQVTITWNAPAGQAVAVEATTSLTTPNWTNAATGVTTGTFSETISGDMKFYRLRLE